MILVYIAKKIKEKNKKIEIIWNKKKQIEQ